MSKHAAKVTPETRAALLVRAGYRCEICGGGLQAWDGHSIHHRTPRGMGGSRDPQLGLPANLLVLCGSGVTGCHGRVEKDRTAAYGNGWLVRRGTPATEVPVLLHQVGWVLLDNEGLRFPTLPADMPPDRAMWTTDQTPVTLNG